ncbi:MAG: DUF2851 family protein [Calditrichaeota bacterium]|nr:MAG: DUF2851 family protein [Calditrichota bacterium]
MPKNPVPETDLHIFWEKSQFFSQRLLTHSGKNIEIIHRGSANKDGGPDYRGIVLRLDDVIIEGDCEIHISPLDWVRHGHHIDPAYNQTCLHISLDSIPPPPIQLENGQNVEQILVPQTEFEHFINRHNPARKVETNACALFSKPNYKKLEILQAAGLHRLRQKARVFQERYDSVSWDQLIYEGIFQALGYSKNIQPFRMLSNLLPIDLVFHEMQQSRNMPPEDTAAALLFGAAGFLETKLLAQSYSSAVEIYSKNLIEFWQHARHILQIQPMQRAQWQFFRLRPQNFPTRRIAGIAHLLAKFQRQGILERLVTDLKNDALSIAEINKNLRHFFTIPTDDFWSVHFDFKERKAPSANKGDLGMLIGKNRADDLVINIIFPILEFYSREVGDSILQVKLLEHFTHYPRLQENTITREMIQKTGLSSQTSARLQYNARIQQGLIHLAKNICKPAQCDQCLQSTPPCASTEVGN